MIKSAGTLLAVLVSFGWSDIANATLISRLGGLAYYDDVLDVTWLADAGVAIGGDGLMTWHEAQTWLGALNAVDLHGVHTWRLPSMDVNGDAYLIKCSSDTEVACRDNELGYMTVQYGVSPTSPGLFSNVGHNYWSSTDYDAANIEHPNGRACNAGPSGNCAWRQGFSADSHNYVRKVYDGYTVWAVASGDVVPVSLPATLALLCLGLAALGFTRRKKAYVSGFSG